MRNEMNWLLRLSILTTIIQVTIKLAIAQSSPSPAFHPVQISHSAEFDAPIDVIWIFFSRFDSISKWEKSLISSCLVSKPFDKPYKSITGECSIKHQGYTPVGSIRDLSVRDKHVYEQLIVLNPKEYRISYQQVKYPSSKLQLSPFPGLLIHKFTNVRLYSIGLNRTRAIWLADLRTDKPVEMYDAFHSVYTRAGQGIAETVRMFQANNINAVQFLQ
ncbi:hypothetical protein K7432_015603 [Basidiobolus ranarum]|uniref:Uncharacterized protein n=1 Tax=Basidiobolus ranarum TaxID=34480 RepID=A0ABR2VNZ7_9FUNG